MCPLHATVRHSPDKKDWHKQRRQQYNMISVIDWKKQKPAALSGDID